MKTKKKSEVPSHALTITGAEFLARLKEVQSKKWEGKMKPMREDVAFTIKEVMKHLAENPEAECMSWWEGEGNKDCDLFTVIIPKESPWLENMRYRIQYENKPGSFAITQAEIIEAPFSDFMMMHKADAIRIINQIDFKGRAQFFRANRGTHEEPYLFMMHRERWEERWKTNPPERFEIDDAGKVSRIQWDSGHVTYDHSDPENLRLINWRDDSEWDEENPEPKTAKPAPAPKKKAPKEKGDALRWRVTFCEPCYRAGATVFSTKGNPEGRTIRLGRTADSVETVAAVEPLPGRVPQLGDILI